MGSEVTLTSSVRQSLLSLKNTQSLVERTQKRLSSGLEVANAVDDAIAFFQSKSLLDRGSDLLEKKDNIDQGVSTVTTALDAVTAIESIVNQMKGIANSMKSATASQMSSLVTTFNELHTQINNVAGDATYQGLNLVNGTGSTLAVEFSELTASSMDVSSVDLRAKDSRTQFSDTRLGLALSNVATYTSDSVFSLSKAATSAANTNAVLGDRYVSADDAFDLTWNGTAHTFLGGETIAFTYGTGATIDLVVQTETPLTVSNGGTINVDVVTSSTSLASTADAFYVGTANTNIVVLYAATTITGGVHTALTVTTSAIDIFTFTYQGNVGLTLTTADNGLSLATGGTADGYGDFKMSFLTGNSITVATGGTFTLEIYCNNTAAAALSTGGGYLVLTAAQQSTGFGFTAVTSTTSVGANDTKMGFVIGRNASEVAVTTLTAGFYDTTTAGNDKVGILTAGSTTEINKVLVELNAALVTLRTNAQTLGTNVALLNTRLDFTEDYVNTLQVGSDKLVLADVNSEGANLLALQTRQQLGIQALSLAAQAEASILRLFG